MNITCVTYILNVFYSDITFITKLSSFQFTLHKMFMYYVSNENLTASRLILRRTCATARTPCMGLCWSRKLCCTRLTSTMITAATFGWSVKQCLVLPRACPLPLLPRAVRAPNLPGLVYHTCSPHVPLNETVRISTHAM